MKELCPDCNEPLTEAFFTYPYKGIMYASYWCENCQDWKPKPKGAWSRRNPIRGQYKENEP